MDPEVIYFFVMIMFLFATAMLVYFWFSSYALCNSSTYKTKSLFGLGCWYVSDCNSAIDYCQC